MDFASFTLLTDDESQQVQAKLKENRVLVPLDQFESSLGWEQKPSGLCKDDRCIPLDEELIEEDKYLDLKTFMDRIGRPFAVDTEEHAGYLGTPSDQRVHQLKSREAPNFRLPDLDGNQHELFDYRGKKIVLVAWASW